MRVIAGTAGGLKLKAPGGLATRPTSDRVREALFAILGPTVEAANFLDLFAGSGAVGIEALSRGASRAVFVERSRYTQEIILENLLKTSLGARAQLLRLPAERAIVVLAKAREEFQLVFLDPPYNKALVPKMMELAVGSNLIANGGLVIAETLSKEELPASVGPLNLYRRAEYGQTALNFYKNEDV